ncbi:hypothetical protein F5X96DRAFT_683405 [Biscogniauxia mediterranea]|nr:hypothetical protein F5X96DRAFT_683405 [Biscogniauxia mediterranea]
MPYVSPLSQMFPGTPAYTEKDMPEDLSTKVYLVTGANTGVGKEVARILYSKNAVVWVAARNEEKAQNAIQSIKEAYPSSTGRLEFLQLDLSDLTTIKASAEKFLAKENRLDVLFNNAGVMFPPHGSKSAQGYELQLGTNNLGHFLFTQLLTPVMVETAKVAPKDSVRVLWVASSAAELLIPVAGGVDLDNLDYKRDIFYAYKYGVSKAGNYYHSTEYARRHRDDGIVSVAMNPGNLRSELYRNCGFFESLLSKAVTYPPVNGAYTELFAGLSDEVTMEKSGCWIVPWGRFGDIAPALLLGSKPESEGGTGIAQKFWDWSEEQTKSFA